MIRAVGGELVGWNQIKDYSLVGWTSLWMIPIGGMSGYIVGILNETSMTRSWKMWQMALLGMVIIFSVELVAGIVCNKLLNMAIWNYSFLDVSGQISLAYAIPWFLMVPFALWLDDVLRHYMFGELRPATFGRYYHFGKVVPRVVDSSTVSD